MANTEALERQRNELAGEMQAILDRVEAEGRDLSRREAAQTREIERQIEAVDASIELRGSLQPRQPARHGQPRAADARLGARPRRGPALAQSEDAERFSLGRLLRGICTGQWEQAEVERRALAEVRVRPAASWPRRCTPRSSSTRCATRRA
jgi:hypothetical protein